MVKPPAAPKPTCGQIVDYVLPGGPTAGENRPAIVIEPGRPNGDGDWEANLNVQLKPGDQPGLPSMDVGRGKLTPPVVYVQSVEPDNGGTGNPRLGTWHWRENADEPKPQTR